MTTLFALRVQKDGKTRLQFSVFRVYTCILFSVILIYFLLGILHYQIQSASQEYLNKHAYTSSG